MGSSARSLVLASLGYALILELLLVPAILYFPDFEENVDALRLAAPIQALKGIVNQIEEGGVVAYVVGQQFFKGCNTLGTAAAVLFAIGAVAGEAHRGTLELWLARPFSRRRLLSERYAAGALATLVPIFATSATIPYLCDLVGEEVDLASMMLCAAHQSALLLAIYSLAFLASTLGSNPVRIALALLFATTFSFAIYMIEVATHYSIYRWTDIQVFMAICDAGALPAGKFSLLIGLCAALFGGSLWAIGRRVP